MFFKAYAKINIGLRVLGKRPDGFHNIETFFQQISLHDVLHINTSDNGKVRISCSDSNCPADETNLAFKAAALLKENADQPSLGCNIHIAKNIPLGGGLGGGSSDAATALKALNALWNIGLTNKQLHELALRIGSDVPFFLTGGFALGQERGERVQKIKVNIPYYGLLYCPGISISTPWVYKNLNLNLTNSNKIGKFVDFVPELPDLQQWKNILPNDLERVVFAEHPSFAGIIREFFDTGAFYARMSGSGSSLFGLYDTLSKAEKAKKSLAKKADTIIFKPIYE